MNYDLILIDGFGCSGTGYVSLFLHLNNKLISFSGPDVTNITNANLYSTGQKWDPFMEGSKRWEEWGISKHFCEAKNIEEYKTICIWHNQQYRFLYIWKKLNLRILWVYCYRDLYEQLISLNIRNLNKFTLEEFRLRFVNSINGICAVDKSCSNFDIVFISVFEDWKIVKERLYKLMLKIGIFLDPHQENFIDRRYKVGRFRKESRIRPVVHPSISKEELENGIKVSMGSYSELLQKYAL